MLPVSDHISALLEGRKTKCAKSYISDVSDSVGFQLDVIACLAPSDLPYDPHISTSKLFSGQGIVQNRVKQSLPPVNGTVPRHDVVPNCLVKKSGKHSKRNSAKVKEWQEYYVRMKHKESEALAKEQALLVNVPKKQRPDSNQTFKLKRQEQAKWSKFALSDLSKDAAEWIVENNVKKDPELQVALKDTVTQWHGPGPEKDSIALFHEDPETSFVSKKEIEPFIGNECKLIQDLTNRMPLQRLSEIEKWRRYDVNEDIANKKAQLSDQDREIEVIKATRAKFLESIKPPNFVSQIKHGKKQVMPTTTEGQILLSDGTEYTRELVDKFPLVPDEWVSDGSVIKTSGVTVEKGLVRWNNNPQPKVLKPLGKSLSVPETNQRPPSERTKSSKVGGSSPEETFQSFILTDFRSTWAISLLEFDMDELLASLADPNPVYRQRAIITCGFLAHLARRNASANPKSMPFGLAPPFPDALARLVAGDAFLPVRQCAAVVLASLEQCQVSENCSSVIERLLFDMLASSQPIDRWTAAQCLVLNGHVDSIIINVLIKVAISARSFDRSSLPSNPNAGDGDDVPVSTTAISPENTRAKQAREILRLASAQSNLTRSLAAELLNSSIQHERLAACQILATLYGTLNRDVLNKLLHVMWFDTVSDVRIAASECLGASGNGHIVHLELCQRLASESTDADKLRTLTLLSHLRCITVRILPSYLKTFDHPAPNIREAACNVARKTGVLDDSVVAKLISIFKNDRLAGVRLAAVKAMIKLKPSPPQSCIDVLIWAVEHGDQVEIRCAAVHALAKLPGIIAGNVDLQEMLKNRLLSELSDQVKVEIRSALTSAQIDPNMDIDMVATLKNEVRKLCTTSHLYEELERNATLKQLEKFKRQNGIVSVADCDFLKNADVAKTNGTTSSPKDSPSLSTLSSAATTH